MIIFLTVGLFACFCNNQLVVNYLPVNDDQLQIFEYIFIVFIINDKNNNNNRTQSKCWFRRFVCTVIGVHQDVSAPQ